MHPRFVPPAEPQGLTMHDGSHTMHYAVVPGSGHGELEGMSGTFHLTVDDAGTHRYELEYEV